MTVAKMHDVGALPLVAAAFTERKRREDEQQLLAVAGELLSSSLDFDETWLAAVAFLSARRAIGSSR